MGKLFKQYSGLRNITIDQQNEMKVQRVKYYLTHIEKIIDNEEEILLTSSLGLLSRNILTDEEVIKNNITVEKLQHIRMAVVASEKIIICLIRLPLMSK